ncbi:MAG: pirin family protein, partial [Nocardioidaceae bacterium]
MAAVSADTMRLPRIGTARMDETERPALAVSTAPAGFEGEGFPVRRTMAGVDYRHLDPFIMMDHMG